MRNRDFVRIVPIAAIPIVLGAASCVSDTNISQILRSIQKNDRSRSINAAPPLECIPVPNQIILAPTLEGYQFLPPSSNKKVESTIIYGNNKGCINLHPESEPPFQGNTVQGLVSESGDPAQNTPDCTVAIGYYNPGEGRKLNPDQACQLKLLEDQLKQYAENWSNNAQVEMGNIANLQEP